jgi:hypothetical protein
MRLCENQVQLSKRPCHDCARARVQVLAQIQALKQILEHKAPRDARATRHGVFVTLVEGAHGQLQRSYQLAAGSALDAYLDVLAGRPLPEGQGTIAAGDLEDLRRLIKVRAAASWFGAGRRPAARRRPARWEALAPSVLLRSPCVRLPVTAAAHRRC